MFQEKLKAVSLSFGNEYWADVIFNVENKCISAVNCETTLHSICHTELKMCTKVCPVVVTVIKHS